MWKLKRLVLTLAALAVILLALSCGGKGYSSPTEPAGPKTVTVAVKDDLYDPKSVTINPGDTVRWVMEGSTTTHTVTDLNGAFDSGAVFTTAGATFEHQFSQANVTYNYFCKVHGACCNMKGSVSVGDAAPPPQPGYR